RELAVSGAATVADSEAAETQLLQAQLAVRKARRDLELTRITAPFAGVVTLRAARPRRLVAPGDTLFRVTAMGPLLARVRVPEAAALDVRPGL
ncbi:MAG TPA: HlyD family efflux transporter periplasmic adaptor subunit, partial [Gemmatimonadales bacterium]